MRLPAKPLVAAENGRGAAMPPYLGPVSPQKTAPWKGGARGKRRARVDRGRQGKTGEDGNRGAVEKTLFGRAPAQGEAGEALSEGESFFLSLPRDRRCSPPVPGMARMGPLVDGGGQTR